MIIVELLCSPTLNRFCLDTDECLLRLVSTIHLTPVSLSIAHLTIMDISIQWNELQAMIQSAPYLRYVNVRLIKKRVFVSQEEILSKVNYISIVQTLILHFVEDDSTTFEMFAKFLQTISNFCRLEVNAHDALIKASAWEQFIKTTLPCWTDFIVKTSESRLVKRILIEAIFSFQTSFWIQKTNFHVLILDEEHLLNDINTIDLISGRKRQTSNVHWNQSSTFLMAIVRPMNGDISPTNIITSLHFPS